jgi:hypothetical protein
MIVKVVHPDSLAAVSAVYFDTERAPVSTGVHFFHEPPGEANYSDIADSELLHVFGVQPAVEVRIGEPWPDSPTGQWPCRFAFWLPEHDMKGNVLVVTTGQIYLMSERGDTIDRV